MRKPCSTSLPRDNKPTEKLREGLHHQFDCNCTVLWQSQQLCHRRRSRMSSAPCTPVSLRSLNRNSRRPISKASIASDSLADSGRRTWLEAQPVGRCADASSVQERGHVDCETVLTSFQPAGRTACSTYAHSEIRRRAQAEGGNNY